MNEPSASVEAHYREGIARFNRGEFYEAHDSWEAAWRNAPAEDRLFYKGLIHATVCIYQWISGNRRSATRLYESAQRYLGGYPDVHRGSHVRSLRERLAIILADIVDPESTAPAGRESDFRGVIRIEVDPPDR